MCSSQLQPPIMDTASIKLTQYSHGAGCGCKIAPAVLSQILGTHQAAPEGGRLLVGNDVRDDAAVYDLGSGQALISTTDFFMPIVDDAFTFGRIAAANAISDVYAMGGTPILAIAILGWPVSTLPPDIAGEVIEGGRSTCEEAGIALAGGHSIDSPEPLFGLAVSGLVALSHLKKNSTAQAGDVLFLTKPLGVGLLTTAEKKGLLRDEDRGRAARQMTRLNRVGEALGRLDAVHAMTDVTGFGLLGHLIELCKGSGLAAEVVFDDVPRLDGIDYYLDRRIAPGGTGRNWDSYGDRIGPVTGRQRLLLCDPQTSGGLLIAADAARQNEVSHVLEEAGLGAFATPIGHLKTTRDAEPIIEVH